jgi:oxygen-independent coproporphyrinogen-3 oxidase
MAKPIHTPLIVNPPAGSAATASGPPSRLNPADLPTDQPVEALYVHVPFCVHKCHYCDFYSITRQSPQRMADFVDRVLIEAQGWANSPIARRIRPRTVFFGGGTPTVLPLQQMQRLLAGLAQRLDLSQVDEWTIEANPATLSLEYCATLRAAGVNRLSFGAQSFNAGELARLERRHEPADVPRSVALARRAGFERLNVDLIYAIPGQSLESWSTSLQAALSLGTGHLSCYGLTYEPNTPLAVKRRLGLVQSASETTELAMLRHTRQHLSAAGMPAYEISNYAVPGDECRHNLNYWNGGNYVALGPSGASHIAGWRWRNRPHLGEWESCTDAGALNVADLEVLSPRRRAGELAMLMLRLTRGVDFAEFADRSGFDAQVLFAEFLQRYAPHALVVVDDRGFRLTEAGICLADALAAELLQTDNTGPARHEKLPLLNHVP